MASRYQSTKAAYAAAARDPGIVAGFTLGLLTLAQSVEALGALLRMGAWSLGAAAAIVGIITVLIGLLVPIIRPSWLIPFKARTSD